MRDIYRKFFKVPLDGKVQDRVMMTRIGMTVAFMLACLMVVSFSAYAYFSSSVSSKTNVISSAGFDISISVKDQAGNDIAHEKTKTGEEKLTLSNGKYAVTLTPVGNASTGFAILSVNGTDYHTAQMFIDKQTQAITTVSFSLEVKGEVTISILANWGTSSRYCETGTPTEPYISESEVIVLDGVQSGSTLSEGEEQESGNNEEETSPPSEQAEDGEAQDKATSVEQEESVEA